VKEPVIHVELTSAESNLLRERRSLEARLLETREAIESLQSLCEHRVKRVEPGEHGTDIICAVCAADVTALGEEPA
jgi:hypothetical protein